MKRRNKNGKTAIRLLTAFSLILVLIIAVSIYVAKAPDEAIPYLWNKISGDTLVEVEKPSPDSLLKIIERKDLLIDSLRGELDKYSQKTGHKKALVTVGTTLNMRDKASLSSNIIARIPDSVYVDVLYYDTKFYYLNGQRGRWCKVRYADKEGWVWDGFLKVED